MPMHHDSVQKRLTSWAPLPVLGKRVYVIIHPISVSPELQLMQLQVRLIFLDSKV